MPSPNAASVVIPVALRDEGERVMRICNACRYCEGYCAVFPAMERRLSFGEHDLTYLANLCHDCGECLDACQYAPPHQFHVDVPRLLTHIRLETYRGYTWPPSFALLFTRRGTLRMVGSIASPLAFVALVGAWAGRNALLTARGTAPGAFYEVVPHTVLIGGFSLVGVVVAWLLASGVRRFWLDTGRRFGVRATRPALLQALRDAATLRYLHGGGAGCPYPGDVPSQARRWCHHVTVYGFALCFAATTAAAIYHNVFGWVAPYPVWSLPVALGSVGGLGLIVGPAGLLALKAVRTRETPEPASAELDETFLFMLLLTSVTGFLLLIVRGSAGMGAVLAVHLGVVFGLFVTMPYGKFVHAGYRLCALVVNAAEGQARATIPGQ